jgi:hypothetical protein
VSGGILFAIISVGGMIILGLMIIGADAFGGKGVRRKELDVAKAQRDLAYDAIEKIAEACEEYKEIDHPLASKLAPLISEFNKAERKLRK